MYKLMRVEELFKLIPKHVDPYAIDVECILRSIERLGYYWEAYEKRPISVDRYGRLTDGIRRIVASKELGITWLPVEVEE